MRRLPLALICALAACSRVTSTSSGGTHDDAATDGGTALVDAVPDAPLDAYVRRPCDAPATFADGRVPSRVLHVEAGAVGGDGSPGAPFGSIAAAAAVATPGTFIRLGPGVHASNQFVPNLRGTPEAPIWIGGELGTRPIIEGGAEAIHLTRPAYVVIQYLDIREQTANGINIDDGVSAAGDAHHVAIVGLDASYIASTATQNCVRATGVDDLFVYDSRFAYCGGGIEQIGVHRAVIARNVFQEMVLYAVRARGGSSDIDVRQNRMHDSGAAVTLGGSTPLSWFRPPVSAMSANAEARRVRAFDNVVTGNSHAPFTFLSCVDCLVAHNLAHGEPAFLLRILEGNASQGGYQFEPTSNGRVINNSFVWRSATLTSHVDVGPGTEPTTFTFSHNLWYDLDAPSLSTPMLPVSETGSVIGAPSGYAPFSDAPYCGGPETGAATPLPEVDGTIEGYCRVDGNAPTIGPKAYIELHCPLL